MKAYKFPTGCARDYGFDRVLIKDFFDYLKPFDFLKPVDNRFVDFTDRGLIDDAPDSARKAYDEYCRCEKEAGRLYDEFEAKIDAGIKERKMRRT